SGEIAGRRRGTAYPGGAAALLLRDGTLPRPGKDRALLPRRRIEAVRHEPTRLQARRVPPRRPSTGTRRAAVDPVHPAHRAGAGVSSQTPHGQRHRRTYRPGDDRPSQRPTYPHGTCPAPHARSDYTRGVMSTGRYGAVPAWGRLGAVGRRGPRIAVGHV